MPVYSIEPQESAANSTELRAQANHQADERFRGSQRVVVAVGSGLGPRDLPRKMINEH
jgi:hypothetical protein